MHAIGTNLGWLMYLVVHPNVVRSGRWISTWSVGCSNCKCWMDTHLTFPVLSCMLKALSESHPEILMLSLYLESKAVVRMCFQ